jgi:aminopeptidase 2
LKRAGTVDDYTLVNKTQQFTIPANATFKLNHQQTGLYRVNYSKELLDRIFNELLNPGYGILQEPIDRAGLVSDIGVLAQSGEQSVLTLLKLLEYLSTERNYFVLSEISRQINSVINLYEDIPAVNDKLQLMKQRLFSPIANNLGWRTFGNEPELYNLLRVLVITEAGLSGQQTVIKSALGRYQQYMVENKTEVITPDMLGTVYRIKLKNAKTEEEENEVWDTIFNRVYHNEQLPMDQRITAFVSIGYTIKYDSVIKKTLELILDTEQVRTQDAWMVFKS